MIAVDTNILVYAHRADSLWNEAAREALRGLAEGRAPWAIPWPCVHEFLSTVTYPKVFSPPSTISEAIREVEAWLGSPSLTLLAESVSHWQDLARLLRESRIEGPRVHDARIAVICQSHGVRELWTADRDFGRFPKLKTRNPLVGS